MKQLLLHTIVWQTIIIYAVDNHQFLYGINTSPLTTRLQGSFKEFHQIIYAIDAYIEKNRLDKYILNPNVIYKQKEGLLYWHNNTVYRIFICVQNNYKFSNGVKELALVTHLPGTPVLSGISKKEARMLFTGQLDGTLTELIDYLTKKDHSLSLFGRQSKFISVDAFTECKVNWWGGCTCYTKEHKN